MLFPETIMHCIPLRAVSKVIALSESTKHKSARDSCRLRSKRAQVAMQSEALGSKSLALIAATVGIDAAHCVRQARVFIVECRQD